MSKYLALIVDRLWGAIRTHFWLKLGLCPNWLERWDSQKGEEEKCWDDKFEGPITS